MPPSRAESVATVGAARTRTRACYVRHRYSVSRPSLSLSGIKPPTFTMVPHAPTLRVVADTLTFPYRPSDRSPFLFSPLPLFVAAVARSGRWPRDHIVCISHTLFTYICAVCTYMQACNAYTTPYHRHRPTSLLPATSVVAALPRKIKLELQRPSRRVGRTTTVPLNCEDNLRAISSQMKSRKCSMSIFTSIRTLQS